MKELKDGLPIIIEDTTKFSCFMGFVSGTINSKVHDQETEEFPTLITVTTNMGGGSITVTLKGNETINKEVQGINIKVEISNWKCTSTELSFHVKASAKKGFLGCTVIDKTLSGMRYNPKEQLEMINEMVKNAEAKHSATNA